MIVRWSAPIGTAALNVRGYVPPVGPVLDTTAWEDVLVIKARSDDGAALELSLEPWREPIAGPVSLRPPARPWSSLRAVRGRSGHRCADPRGRRRSPRSSLMAKAEARRLCRRSARGSTSISFRRRSCPARPGAGSEQRRRVGLPRPCPDRLRLLVDPARYLRLPPSPAPQGHERPATHCCNDRECSDARAALKVRPSRSPLVVAVPTAHGRGRQGRNVRLLRLRVPLKSGCPY